MNKNWPLIKKNLVKVPKYKKRAEIERGVRARPGQSADCPYAFSGYRYKRIDTKAYRYNCIDIRWHEKRAALTALFLFYSFGDLNSTL